MITVSITWGDFSASVASDLPPFPELLDELSSRCVTVFAEACAAMPEGESDAEAG